MPPPTEPTTRQRLLELWEKCPECRPDYLTWCSSEKAKRSGRFAGWMHDCPMSEDTAFALARDAMDTYLAVMGFAPKVSYENSMCFKVEIARSDLVPEIQEFTGEDKTDALISAVEAVMDANKGKSETS